MMEQVGFDKHQLAGLDDRERGFSRPVEFEHAAQGYRAVLRYEALRIATGIYSTENEALSMLIQILLAQGYRQLKTQMSFRNGVYLGSQELWIEYPDPPQTQPEQAGLFDTIKNWFRPRSSNE